MSLKVYLGGIKIDLHHILKQFVIVVRVLCGAHALIHTLPNTWNERHAGQTHTRLVQASTCTHTNAG